MARVASTGQRLRELELQRAELERKIAELKAGDEV